MVHSVSGFSFQRLWRRLGALALIGLLPMALQAQSLARPWSWATTFEHPTLNGDFTDLVSAAWVNTAVDSAGNQYVAGVFRGSVAFGSTVLTSHTLAAYACDLYVAKLSPQGQWLWAVNAGGVPSVLTYGLSTGIRADAIGLDARGNVYVAGAFRGAVTFGSNTLQSGDPAFLDVYVAKLSPQGQWLNVTQGRLTGGSSGPFNGIGIKGRLALAVSPAGDAYLTGIYGGIMRFGTHQLPNCTAAASFLARLSAAGQWRWVATNDGALFTHVAVDPQERLTVAGTLFLDIVRFGNIQVPLPSGIGTGGNDVFVARMDSAGQWLGAAGLGAVGADYIKSLCVDNSGNAYVSGGSQFSTIVIGTDTVRGDGTVPAGVFAPAAYLAKFTPANTWAWARTGIHEEVVSDRQNGLYTLAAGQVRRLDQNGQPLANGPVYAGATTLAAGPAGQVAVAGPLRGNASFGVVTLTVAPDFGAVFAARLSAANQWLWAAQAQAGGSLYLNDLVADNLGYLYATGTLSGTVAVGGSVISTTGDADLVVVKLDRQGQVLWVRQAGGTRAGGEAVATDGQGDVWVYGLSEYPIRLAGQTLSGGFVGRLSGQGQWQWAAPAPHPGTNRTLSLPFYSESDFHHRTLAVDPAGHAWLGGNFVSGDTIRLGSQQWTGQGGTDGFLAHYSPGGQLVSFEPIGGVSDDLVKGVTTDARGNVSVAGYFGQTLQLGPIQLVAGGNASADGFVARRNRQGWQWAQRISGQQEMAMVTAVAAEPAGGFVLAAVSTGDSATFGTRPLPKAGAYVVRLDSLGQLQALHELEGTGLKYIASLNLDNQGNAFVYGGVMVGSVRFGTDSIVGSRIAPPVQPDQSGYQRVQGGPPGPPIPAYFPFLGVLSTGGQWLWGTSEVGITATAAGRGDAFTTRYLGGITPSAFGPLNLPPMAHGVGLVAGMLGTITATAAEAVVPGATALWPNPATSNVRLTGAPAGPITLLDAVGRAVRTWPGGQSNLTLDLTGLRPGLYLVRAGSVARRLVVE